MDSIFINKLSEYGRLSKAGAAAVRKVVADPTSYPPKHDLIRAGDQASSVFVVLEGWAVRYKILPNGSRQIFGIMLPGDVCDLHAGALGEMDHNIQTVTAAVVSQIARNEMDTLMDRHREVERAMYVLQLAQEGMLRAWVTCICRKSSVERIAHFLSELYVRAQNVGLVVDRQLTVPFTQAQLADATGMTNVHANRILKDLRELGVMTIGRKNIVITDIRQLIRLAGFDDNYLNQRSSR